MEGVEVEVSDPAVSCGVIDVTGNANDIDIDAGEGKGPKGTPDKFPTAFPPPPFHVVSKEKLKAPFARAPAAREAVDILAELRALVLNTYPDLVAAAASAAALVMPPPVVPPHQAALFAAASGVGFPSVLSALDRDMLRLRHQTAEMEEVLRRYDCAGNGQTTSPGGGAMTGGGRKKRRKKK